MHSRHIKAIEYPLVTSGGGKLENNVHLRDLNPEPFLAGEPAWMDVLVDILLSLLGRAGDALPFHPLREACEALFRAFAEQVTPQGFEDLIRVVQQTSESPDKEEDDEEMFEDEGEDEEQALKGGGTCLMQSCCGKHTRVSNL